MDLDKDLERFDIVEGLWLNEVEGHVKLNTELVDIQNSNDRSLISLFAMSIFEYNGSALIAMVGKNF